MKKFTIIPILIFTATLMILTPNIVAADHFIIEYIPAKNIDSEYQDVINKMVLQCFLNNGNFVLSNGDDINPELSKSKKPGSKIDFYLTVNVKAIKMEKIKAASYNYYTKETTFSDCYNFVLEFDLELTDVTTKTPLFKNSFEYNNRGPFEPGIIARSKEKAVDKTTHLLMANIFSWINSEIATSELILARLDEIKTDAVVAIRK